MTPVMRHDGLMEENTEQVRNRPEPAEPHQDAGQSNESDLPPALRGRVGEGSEDPKDPKVPPSSETWVEGQPTSDADYGGDQGKSE